MSLALWLEEIKNGRGDFFWPLRQHGVASAIDFLQRYTIAELTLDQAPVFWGSNHVLKTHNHKQPRFTRAPPLLDSLSAP